MSSIFSEGIPSKTAYKTLLNGSLFKEMEQFSEQFLINHKAPLDKYAKKWVSDPLHQWSRQWEYPYVFEQISKWNRISDRVDILDAGSGITFFPYYLSAQFKNATVSCCDYDSSLAEIFEQINVKAHTKVQFSGGDLRQLNFEDGSFDIIYCISVLEHTQAYAKIIDEFYRLLRPEGQLVITFDISIDGSKDIAPERGNELLRLLYQRFGRVVNGSVDLRAQLKGDIFTTLTANELNADLLPWRLPSFFYQAKALIREGKRISWPPPLTFYCLCLTKNNH